MSQPYRPANGMEGWSFQQVWCRRCAHDDATIMCEILARAESYDLDDEEYPDEWQYHGDTPVCTAFAVQEGR